MNDLIKRFKELPETKKEDENIFSICGFPHYERVTSNVLAFFLNNQREHGLGNLFIESLLALDEQKQDNEFDLNYSVVTETKTDKGNFIDIDISGDGYRIIIENKIFASLYNDLSDYYYFASKDNTRVIAYVLSLNPQNQVHKNYSFITYEAFFNQVKQRMGEYLIQANQKYLPMLFDLIKNIENLRQGDTMDLEFINFVKENKEDVGSINIRLKQLHDDLRKTVQSVNSIILEQFVSDKYKQWAWRRLPDFFDIAVTDIKINDVEIAIDSTIDLSGWHFEIFMRKPSNEFVLETWFDRTNIGYLGKKGKRVLLTQKFEVNENPMIIAKFIIGLIEEILKGL